MHLQEPAMLLSTSASAVAFLSSKRIAGVGMEEFLSSIKEKGR